uniref:protein LURP-one-related 11-like n=1 Tax=Erigeron canadensis TaxID=72917 RepID=UPI001CB8CF4B|nr:protein LURP-one-related 11-like [Erigeron canadensis]
MSKIHPQTLSTSSSSYITSSMPESFTIWMKSLVFNTHGCTVYNSKGDIVYRVDNYDNKCGHEVYLMDIRGKVLFSLQQKKLRLFGCWDGYKWDDCSLEKQLWFRVRKHRSICMASCDRKTRGCTYKVVRLDGKLLGFKIIDEDRDGALVAEIKQKQTTTGINFGNDVFTLIVQPHIDHSLIMAIVMVYGLINNQM